MPEYGADADLASLERRVRWLDRFFRWGLGLLPGTAIGRPLLQELVLAYEHADERSRSQLREMLQDREGFVQNTALADPVDTPEGFRRHLLHYSLVYPGGDPRDAVLWLHDLCQEARAAGVAIDPILRQVAEISSDEGEGTWSARAQLFATAGPNEAFTSAPRRRKRRRSKR